MEDENAATPGADGSHADWSEGSGQGAHLPRARSVERREQRRARAQAAPRHVARSFVQLPKKFSPRGTVVAAVLVIILALAVSTPLRNYFEQQSELAQLEARIESQERQKAELTEELNRYSNEDYIKEQARTRLGLIEPGESAFRIISPKIGPDGAAAEAIDDDQQPEKRWYGKLWDSIALSEQDLDEKELTGEVEEDHQLPTVPAP